MTQQKLKILYSLLENYEINNIEQVEEIYHYEKIKSNIYYNTRFFIIIGCYATIYLIQIFSDKIGIVIPTLYYTILKLLCGCFLLFYFMTRVISNYQKWTSLFISATNSICFRNNLNGFNTFTADLKDVCSLLNEVKIGALNSLKDEIVFAGDLLQFYHVRNKFINFI